MASIVPTDMNQSGGVGDFVALRALEQQARCHCGLIFPDSFVCRKAAIWTIQDNLAAPPQLPYVCT